MRLLRRAITRHARHTRSRQRPVSSKADAFNVRGHARVAAGPCQRCPARLRDFKLSCACDRTERGRPGAKPGRLHPRLPSARQPVEKIASGQGICPPPQAKCLADRRKRRICVSAATPSIRAALPTRQAFGLPLPVVTLSERVSDNLLKIFLPSRAHRCTNPSHDICLNRRHLILQRLYNTHGSGYLFNVCWTYATRHKP